MRDVAQPVRSLADSDEDAQLLVNMISECFGISQRINITVCGYKY